MSMSLLLKLLETDQTLFPM